MRIVFGLSIIFLLLSIEVSAQTDNEELFQNSITLIECSAFQEVMSEVSENLGMAEQSLFFHEIHNGYLLAGKFIAAAVVKEEMIEAFVENIYETRLNYWRASAQTGINNNPQVPEQNNKCIQIAPLQIAIIDFMRKNLYLQLQITIIGLLHLDEHT